MPLHVLQAYLHGRLPQAVRLPPVQPPPCQHVRHVWIKGAVEI